MGRNKEPMNLILAKGNKSHKTKEEINSRLESEVKANVDNIFAPSYLSAKLKKRFNYLAQQLVEINILTNLDVECLGRYVSLENQYNLLTKSMTKIDVINDAENYDKMLTRQTKVYNMLTKNASDLGLTISSRCKLAVPIPEEKKVNKFDKFGADNNDK